MDKPPSKQQMQKTPLQIPTLGLQGEIAERLVSGMRLGVLVYDLQGRCVFVNSAGADLLGKQPKQLVGADIGQMAGFFTDSQSQKTLVELALAAGKPVRKFVEVHKTGETIACDCVAQPLLSPEGQIDLVVITLSDLSDQMQLEQRIASLSHDLGERRKELRCIYEVMKAIGMHETLEAIFLELVKWIPLSWQYPDVTRARIVFDDKEYVTESFPTSRWCQASDLLVDTVLRGRIEVYYLEPQAESYEGPFLKEERELLDTLATILNRLVERRTRENALRESESRYRTLFDRSAEGIVLLKDGQITECNTAYAHVLGYEPDEIVGHTPMELSPSHQPDGRLTQEVGDEYIASALAGEPQRFHWLHRRKDASPMDAEVFLIRLQVSGETVLLGTLRDITERLQAEKERQELQAKIQYAQKLESLGLMAGGIAHDFNNLLVAIMGNAGLALRDTSEDSAVRNHLLEIEKASHRAAGLCSQMLAYSGKGRFIVEPVDLSTVVRGIGEMLEASISSRAIIRYSLSDKLPMIEADIAQLRQVIMNLAVNAAEAIVDPPGNVTVLTDVCHSAGSVECGCPLSEELPSGTYVTLVVEDNGCGMDEDTVGRIFDPFFTTKFTGRGLGLAAVQGIVRSHNGGIRIDSQVGRGTRVTVFFPARCGDAEHQE